MITSSKIFILAYLLNKMLLDYKYTEAESNA